MPPLILNFNRLPQGSAADGLWTTLFDALEQIMPGPVSCIIHMQPQKKFHLYISCMPSLRMSVQVDYTPAVSLLNIWSPHVPRL